MFFNILGDKTGRTDKALLHSEYDGGPRKALMQLLGLLAEPATVVTGYCERQLTNRLFRPGPLKDVFSKTNEVSLWL